MTKAKVKVKPTVQTLVQPESIAPNPAAAGEGATCNTSLIGPPISSSQAVTMIEAKPLLASGPPRKTRRNGRIAALPKLERDMVNRMIWNGVPYKNIVGALSETGYFVTERNISNWATGGHLEWRLVQEHVLDNRHDQDQLLDFLRRDDAPDLPEVGLQAAATRLSQVLVQKLARAEDPEANLDNYSKMVDLLSRLNREIAASQKERDDAQRSLGDEYDPARVKDADRLDALEHERFYSDPDSDSGLSKPTVPPLLPPIPTGTIMAQQAEEERHEEELAHMKHVKEIMKSFSGKKTKPEDIVK